MKRNAFLPNTTINRLSTSFGRMIQRLAVFALLALSLGSPAAHAQAYGVKTIHTFQGKPTEGDRSYASLIDVNGTLYGTTYFGGANGYGTIFSVNPDGSGFTTRYSFTAINLYSPNPDGASPDGSLININGALYGVAYLGGLYGHGVVFKFDPTTNTETAIYSFPGGTSDGAHPAGRLIDVYGLLYGTTSDGGVNGSGTVFSIDPLNGALNTIYTFGASSTDAAYPSGDLILVNGLIYGTTGEGGSINKGTVYVIDPTTKTEQVLHTFTGTDTNNDGYLPFAGLTLVNNILYGTTYFGGTNGYGTIFSINTNGNGYQVLYNFYASVDDGANPYSGLTYDSGSGKLFGTTISGGNSNNAAASNNGTVFSFDPTTQTETTLFRFTALDSSGHNTDGANPRGTLLNINGTLYGTTQYGGSSGKGTIFTISPVTIPIAKNDAGRGIANHTIIVGAPGVLGNDNNGGDRDTKTTLVTGPTHGTIVFNSNGSFNYTPSKNFVGSDSFTYKDTNSVGTSNTATCSLTIGPVAYDDAGRTYYNTPVTVNAPGVLANDVTGGVSTTASLVTNPAHGTIVFNSDGSFKYTPTSGFLQTDSFTYKITNAAGTSAPATCTILVQARTPIANNDHGTVTHNTTATFAAPAVLGNDYPGTTGTVTASLVTSVSHGTLTFNSNGSFVYKPTTGFIGTDSFTYKDTNSVGTSNTATCTIAIQ